MTTPTPSPSPASAPLPVSTDADGIITLTLEQPDSPVVVLDLGLIQRLESALKGLPRTGKGLILASASSRVFVAGADLKTIQLPEHTPQAEADRALDAYLAYGQRVFGLLCDLPYPTAAAIAGAALGGGLELAMHCDGLIGSPSLSGKPFPVGLPEAGLSICPGWGGTNLLPARIDPAHAIRATALGKPLTSDEAFAANLFDRVAPDAGSLLATAKAWLLEQSPKLGQPGGLPRRDGTPSRWIGRANLKPRVLAALAQIRAEPPQGEPAAAVLDAVQAGLDTGWSAALDVERRQLVRLRGTPAGKSAIQAFFDKSKK